VYSRRALADLERIGGFLAEEGREVVERALDAVIDAIKVLRRHPLIGRPVEHDLRELVISRGKTGYIALYDFLEERDLLRILAIWHQRELGTE
jgi:plasmid stabilization system protein ParE